MKFLGVMHIYSDEKAANHHRDLEDTFEMYVEMFVFFY